MSLSPEMCIDGQVVFDGWNDEDKAKAIQKSFRQFNRSWYRKTENMLTRLYIPRYLVQTKSG